MYKYHQNHAEIIKINTTMQSNHNQNHIIINVANNQSVPISQAADEAQETLQINSSSIVDANVSYKEFMQIH